MSDFVVSNVSHVAAPIREHLLQSYSILIVDDDEDILEIAAEILQTLGYNILTARSGLEAATLLRRNPQVTILFTDMEMPGMGGEELAETAVALRSNIRVIFTSGRSRPRSDALFLQKPYRMAELVRLFPPQSVSWGF